MRIANRLIVTLMADGDEKDHMPACNAPTEDPVL